MVKNGKSSRFIGRRNNWRYKLAGALKEARYGKMIKPAGRFVRSVILVDALKIGRSQNSKMVYPIGRVRYIRSIVHSRRPVLSVGVSVARSTYRALFRLVGMPPCLVLGVKALSLRTSPGPPRNATDR